MYLRDLNPLLDNYNVLSVEKGLIYDSMLKNFKGSTTNTLDTGNTKCIRNCDFSISSLNGSGSNNKRND